MLKKSLHYLIRCSFLLLIICTLITMSSCRETPEDYFLFLKRSCEYDVVAYKNGRKISECVLCLDYGDNKSKVKMDLTYPKALDTCKIEVTFSPDSEEYLYNGIQLPSESIPSLWREIYELFIPGNAVISMQNENGSTHIETSKEKDAENIFYTLDKNGFPTEIKHGDLRIETNIRNSEEN